MADIIFRSVYDDIILVKGFSIIYWDGTSVYNENQMDDFKKELQNIIDKYHWEKHQRYWTIEKGEGIVFDGLELEIPDFYR